jgi:c(7)-type cytochrome triheme protein
MKVLTFSLVILLALSLVSVAMAVLPTAKVVYPDGEMGKVPFNGATHGPQQGMKCADCHPEPFGPATKHPSLMNFTVEDHIDGKFCGKCHDGKEHFGKTVFSWSAKESCTKCHMRCDAADQEEKKEETK